MVFKNIDGQLTTIFNKTSKISSGFNLATNEVSVFVDKFNKINSEQNFDENWIEFLDKVYSKNANVANMFEELAKQGASAQASVENVYAAILNGNTTGFKNVQSIIQTFNSVDPSRQQEFAKAVGQTNGQLGQYLINTQVGSASMKGYGAQLVANTAKTVGLQVATMALNAAISLGFTALISGAIIGINKFVNYQKELAEKAKEAASSLKEEKESIEEYKTKITELKNALADETTSEEDAYNARKQLLEIQDEVVSKYGLQKDSIDLVNDSLREEIALLDEVSQKQAGEFLRENKKAINNATKKVETTKSFSKNFSRSSFDSLDDLADQLYKNGFISIRSQHDGTTSFDSNFKGTTDEAIEYYTKLYDYINKYRQDNVGALSDTKNGLENIDKILASVSQKINDINDENYQNAKELYDSAITSMLQTDQNYKDIYNATLEARQDFQSALANNNEDSINKSLDSMKQAKEMFEQAVEDGTIVDFGVSEWFNNFYNDFESESGKYQFKIDVSANTDGLKNSVQKTLDYFGDKTPTKFDILNLKFKGDEKAQSAFQSLTSVAEQYKMTIEDLISVLEDLEIVQIDEKNVDITAGVVSTIQNNLAKLKSKIEDIFKNTDLFDEAIESLNKGESIDFDSVMSIIEVDESLVDKFIQTTDGYTVAVDKLISAKQKYTKETKASIQTDIESAKQTIKIAEQNIIEMQKQSDSMAYAATQDANAYKAKKELDEAIQAEKEHIKALNTTISENSLILGEMESSVLDAKLSIEELSAILDTASKKQSALKSAMEDMTDTGYISASTYATLVELGGNFAECLEVQNGKLVLNIEKLKELEAAEYDTAIAAKELEIAKWKAINAASLKGDFSNQKELEIMEQELAFLNQLRNEWNNTKLDNDTSSSSNDDLWKDEAQSKIADVEHLYAMEQITYEEYINEIDKINQEYFANNEKYLDDYRKYEEEVYKGRKQLAEDLYNEQQKLFENRISDLEAQIDITTSDSTDSQGNKLGASEKFDYLRAVYDDILSEIDRRINEIVQSGVEGHEDELKELEQQYKEYADKKSNIFKDEIEYEIDYIEHLQDKYDDFIDKIIDRYEDEKAAVEDRYDTEINKIEETINALKDKNNETQTAIDLKKAEQDLENAKQRTRMVYGANGTITYKQDDEAIAEAQQKVDDLKLDMIVSNLEKQKEALEEQKDIEVDKFDDIIDSLNEQKEQQSDYYDKLIEILNVYLNPNATENINSVWERVLADKDKVQTNEGFTTVNGESINTSNVDKGEVKSDKVNNQLENAAKIDFKEILKDIGVSESIAKSLTPEKLSQIFGLSSVKPNTTIINQPDVSKWITQTQTQRNNNNNSQPVNMTFGDIVIQNPVGDAKKLAQEIKNNILKEFMMGVPNGAMKIIYGN